MNTLNSELGIVNQTVFQESMYYKVRPNLSSAPIFYANGVSNIRTKHPQLWHYVHVVMRLCHSHTVGRLAFADLAWCGQSSRAG